MRLSWSFRALGSALAIATSMAGARSAIAIDVKLPRLPPPRPPPSPADLPSRPTEPAKGAPAEPGLAAERIERTAFPIIGGNSDVGVQFGAAGTLTRFHGDARPYLWNLGLLLSASLKNDQDSLHLVQQRHVLHVDAPALLEGKLRLDIFTQYQRTINAGYYGLGNASSGDLPPGASDPGRRYQYLDLLARTRVVGRVRTGTIVDLAFGATLRYQVPGVYGGSKLAEDAAALEPDGSPRIRGVDGGGLGGLAVGAVIDTRDNEFVTTRGLFYELGLGGTMGTSDGVAYGNASLVVSHYVPVWGPFVFASRLVGSAQFGHVPFYELAVGGTFLPHALFGGDSGVRGVPQGRYAGLLKVLTNTEVRTLLPRFRLFDERFRVGITTFIDAGRLWRDYRYDPVSDGTGLGFKYGVGGGTFIQWGEAAIFRLEAAYSPDAAAANPGFPVGIYVVDGLIF